MVFFDDFWFLSIMGSHHTWVFPKIGVFPPKWKVKIMENPIKMDDLGIVDAINHCVCFVFFPSNQWIDSRNREDSCIGASMRWVVSGGSCWSFQITHRLVELCFCQATGELNFPSEEIGEAWVVWRCTTIGRLGAECERVRYLTCTFCCLLDWKLK